MVGVNRQVIGAGRDDWDRALKLLETTTNDAAHRKRLHELQRHAEGLSEREKALKLERAALDEREKALDAREVEVDGEVDRRLEVYRAKFEEIWRDFPPEL